METDFFFSGHSILLFGALLKFLKFGGGIFLNRNLIPANENWFSGYWKLIFFISLKFLAMIRLVQRNF